jgi:GNAT superfamily N-acetyltransferase
MNPVTSPRSLAGLIPDEPLWIDLRGLLLTERCEIWAETNPEHGFVARSWDYPFASLFGEPRSELVIEATAAGLVAFEHLYPRSEWQLLATPQNRSLVKTALPGWRRTGIVIHRPARDPVRPMVDPTAEIRLLPGGLEEASLTLEHVPEKSRQELELEWVSSRPIAVAIVDGRAVTFCYAAFTTERLWDVSIETLEPFRRRGLGAACFLALAAHMVESGKTPAWGAMVDNPASLGLAAKLGFVRDSTLDGWSEA